MNIDLEEYLQDSYTREAMISEAAIQAVMDGAYFDPEDIRTGFKHQHWVDMFFEQSKKYGIE